MFLFLSTNACIYNVVGSPSTKDALSGTPCQSNTALREQPRPFSTCSSIQVSNRKTDSDLR